MDYALEEACVPAFCLTEDGQVSLWNRALAQLTGTDTKVVVGRPLEELVHQDSTGDVHRYIRDLHSSPHKPLENARLEFVHCRTGALITLRTNMTASLTFEDRVDRIVAICDVLRCVRPLSVSHDSIDLPSSPIIPAASDDEKRSINDLPELDVSSTPPSRQEAPNNNRSRNDHIGFRSERRGSMQSDAESTTSSCKMSPYGKALMAANVPVFELDHDARIMVWNAKTASLTGFSSEGVVGQLLTDTVDASSKDRFQHAFQTAVDTQRAGDEFEVCFTANDGSHAEVMLSLSPQVDDDGRVIGVMAIGQDVKHQSSNDSSMINTANAPIFGIDIEGRIVIFNKKASKVTEFSPEEVLGCNLIETLAQGSVREAVANVFDAAVKGQATANFEFPLATRSGKRISILLNVTPRYDHHGRVIGAVGIGQDITERVVQEEELRRLIYTANAPIVGVDKDYKINIWNRKATTITEYNSDEAIGYQLTEFLPEGHKESVQHVFQQALEEAKETARFEFPLVTKEGRELKILLNATPRFDHKGRIIGVVGIGHDFTDLKAQEQEYARLIETANAPIFGVDVDFSITIWNRKAAEVTGYSAEEALGTDLIQEFIPDEYKVQVRGVLSLALDGEETANFEFPLVTRGGRRVEVLLNATPRYDERQNIIGVVGIGQDITARIAQEQEYRRLIDTANAPIFGVDQDGLVTIWNNKAAEITQYTNEDVMGEHLVNKFITDDYKEAVASVLSKALEGTETANFEFPLMTKGGRRVEILLNATPRYNEHGQVIGMVGIGQDITDRIAQEQEHMKLIENANAPIFGVNVDGFVTIWNQKMADITQYTKVEAIGKYFVNSFVEPTYRGILADVLSDAQRSAFAASNVEIVLTTKTGRRANILMNATVRFGQHGEVEGVVGIGQDITDRLAQEQEYTRLIDTANAPIFGVDDKGLVTIWNKKAAQLTQYKTREVVGQNLVETFVSPKHRPAVKQVFAKALEGIQTANFDFPLITKSGTRVDVLLNATPRNDPHGNIVGVVGIGQDITDRIAQEHEYYRLIDSANAPIFGVDPFGCVNEWNQKIGQLTGYAKKDVVGESLVERFVAQDSADQVWKQLRQALIGIDVGEMELPIHTKSGRSLLLLVNASSKMDLSGNIVGVIGVGQDYTAKKRMEAARVNFLASFSHELRTPLNGVLGMLELIRNDTLERKTRKRYVDMAYISGSLLLNLINDILDLSKIEAGHMEINYDPFHLDDLLSYVIELFKFKAKEKKIDLVLEAGDLPHALIGDVGRLRQILLNFLSNAIKFTKKGSITVKCHTVSATDVPPEKKRFLFEVVDTGIGMTSEEMAHLFEIFFKVNSMKKDNPTGSGLGLAICKQLVELMGGQIGVESEKFVGSNFYFIVDLEVANEESTSSLFRPENADTKPAIHRAVSDDLHASVLVVEDNDFNWEIVCAFLCNNGEDHFVRWEANGQAALEAYKKHHECFDLVLMDCEMPVMDGYNATRSIRKYEKDNGLPRMPVLGLTAYAMHGDRQKCLDAGMDEFLVKPIGQTTLLQAIHTWKGKKRTTRGLIDRMAAGLQRASQYQQHITIDKAISALELEDPSRVAKHGDTLMIAHEPSGIPTTGSLYSSEGSDSRSQYQDSDLSRSRSWTQIGSRSLPAGCKFPFKDAHGNVGTSTMPASEIKVQNSSRSRRHTFFPYLSKSQGVNQIKEGIEENEPDPPLPVMLAVNPLDSVVLPDGDPINFAKGVSQCGGKEPLFMTFLENYNRQVGGKMAQIQNAFEQKDWQTVKSTSHSLKGMSAYAAAERVEKSAQRLELASTRLMSSLEQVGSVEREMRLLRDEYEHLKGYLRRNFEFGAPETKKKVDQKDDGFACALM